MGHEELPLPRGHRPVTATLKEFYAQNGFEFRDCLGDGRLRNRKAVSGPLDAPELGYGQKAL
jgi:hypothetical protein